MSLNTRQMVLSFDVMQPIAAALGYTNSAASASYIIN
jgi:hypothetical protein